MRPARIGSERPVVSSQRGPRLPWQLATGLAVLIPSWLGYWTVTGKDSEDILLSLWLAYILIVDGLVHRRTGASLLMTSPGLFAALFPASFLFWFPFELTNHFLHLWIYLGSPRLYLVPLRYERLALRSLLIALMMTVVPTLWETAALYRSFIPCGTDRPSVVRASRRWEALPVAVGIACLAAPFVWPHLAYPLIWLPMFLIPDALNARAGRPSLIVDAAHGRLATLTVYAAAGLTCGLFWEFWNDSADGYHWAYNLPHLNNLPHLFAMPAPGYLGYVPFGWSAYAVGHLVWRPGRRRMTRPEHSQVRGGGEVAEWIPGP
jgi:hypothetical protein